MPNCEIFGTTNDALREATVGIEKKERKVICPFCGEGGQIRHFCTLE